MPVRTVFGFEHLPRGNLELYRQDLSAIWGGSSWIATNMSAAGLRISDDGWLGAADETAPLSSGLVYINFKPQVFNADLTGLRKITFSFKVRRKPGAPYGTTNYDSRSSMSMHRGVNTYSLALFGARDVPATGYLFVEAQYDLADNALRVFHNGVQFSAVAMSGLGTGWEHVGTFFQISVFYSANVNTQFFWDIRDFFVADEYTTDPVDSSRLGPQIVTPIGFEEIVGTDWVSSDGSPLSEAVTAPGLTEPYATSPPSKEPLVAKLAVPPMDGVTNITHLQVCASGKIGAVGDQVKLSLTDGEISTPEVTPPFVTTGLTYHNRLAELGQFGAPGDLTPEKIGQLSLIVQPV